MINSSETPALVLSLESASDDHQNKTHIIHKFHLGIAFKRRRKVTAILRSKKHSKLPD